VVATAPATAPQTKDSTVLLVLAALGLREGDIEEEDEEEADDDGGEDDDDGDGEIVMWRRL
jgi:hypothetical protein